MTGSSINIKELLEDAVENVIDTELDELYDRIELLFNKVNDGISITGSPEIIQKNQYADISVRAVKDGVPLDNKTIYFYEIIRPTLSLTSPINTIQSGDRCDFSVKVKDEDGSIVDGEIVKFYTLVSEHYTYIGSGETDANGVAHLSIDTAGNSLQNNGYLADGDGNIEIVAKYDDELSQPLLVGDCVKYDNGILNDPQTRDIYETRSSNTSFERKSEYSEIAEITTGTNASLVLPNIPNDCVIDLELCQVNGLTSNTLFGVYQNNSYKTANNLGQVGYSSEIIGNWIKLRIDFRREGYVTYTNLEDSTKTYTNPTAFTGQANRLYFTTSDECTMFRLRNVKVYPLNSASNVVSSISASATNPIIQSGESSTITARAIGTDGGLVRHQPIKVYNGNTLIGTMTDNKGVHTYSYTGTGRGAITLKCGNVQSETYDVLDVLFKQKCTSNDSDEFINQFGILTDNGDTFTFVCHDYSYSFLWCNLKGTGKESNRGDYTGDLCFEIEVTEVTTANFGFYNDLSISSQSILKSLRIGVNKVILKNGAFQFYINGNPNGEPVTNTLQEPYRIGIIPNNNGQVTFKNIKVYQI